MQRNALLSLTLGAILFVAHPAHAQFIGDRMRIKTEDGEKFIGQLKGYNADSLIILTNSTELSIAYIDMARLHRSLGGRARYKNRAMVGLGAGMVVGLVAAGDITGASSQFATVAGVGLLGGMGGLVNAGIRRERWERMDIPGQNTPLIMPEIGIHPPEILAQDSVSVTPGIGVQSPGPLAFENRVRITTENGEKLIGHLKEYDAHSLTILTGFTEQSIAYTDMARLQRSLGIRSYSRDAAITGLVVGVGGSIAVTAALQDGWAAVWGIGFFTPVLGLGGMISGRAIRRERWKRLDIPDQDAAFVMPDTDNHPGGRVTLENRMRVTTKNGEKLIGQVKGYDADSLTILTDSKEQSIAYTDMARLHRSLGVRSHVLKGTLLGLGAGMIVGISAASNIECNNESCVGEAVAATGIFLLGSGGGTLLGALVGVANRTERWKRVDIPDQSTVSVTPVIGVHPGGSLALGARISF